MSIEDSEDRIDVKAFAVVHTSDHDEIHQLLRDGSYIVRTYKRGEFGNEKLVTSTYDSKPEGLDIELKENILYKT